MHRHAVVSLLLISAGGVIQPQPRALQFVSPRVTAQSQIRALGRNTPVTAGTGELTGFVCPSNAGGFTNFVSAPYAPMGLTCERGYYHDGGSAHAWRVQVRCSSAFDASLFPYDFTASTPCVTTLVPAASGVDPGCGVGATTGRPCFCSSTTWGFDYFAGTAKCLAWCVAVQPLAPSTTHYLTAYPFPHTPPPPPLSPPLTPFQPPRHLWRFERPHQFFLLRAVPGRPLR